MPNPEEEPYDAPPHATADGRQMLAELEATTDVAFYAGVRMLELRHPQWGNSLTFQTWVDQQKRRRWELAEREKDRAAIIQAIKEGFKELLDTLRPHG